MGQFLMTAPVSQTVANEVPQLSQSRSTLRHCASCLSPYGGKAHTGAVLLRGLLAQKRSVANTIWLEPSPQGVGRSGSLGVYRGDRTVHAAVLIALKKGSANKNPHHGEGRRRSFRAKGPGTALSQNLRQNQIDFSMWSMWLSPVEADCD